jgi:hypothetical protein
MDIYRALAYCSMVPPDYKNALADLDMSFNLSENKFKAVLQVSVHVFKCRYFFNLVYSRCSAAS